MKLPEKLSSILHIHMFNNLKTNRFVKRRVPVGVIEEPSPVVDAVEFVLNVCPSASRFLNKAVEVHTDVHVGDRLFP